MARKTLHELAEALAEAHQKVEVGARYMHYKQSYYVVKDLVIWEDTDEVAVIYQAEYDEQLRFARSLHVWLESVEADGQKMQRFVRVSGK